jgi:hypothetical protein
VVKDIEKNNALSNIDMSKIVDLYDEEGILQEMNADNLVIESDEQQMLKNKKKPKKEVKK